MFNWSARIATGGMIGFLIGSQLYAEDRILIPMGGGVLYGFIGKVIPYFLPVSIHKRSKPLTELIAGATAGGITAGFLLALEPFPKHPILTVLLALPVGAALALFFSGFDRDK